MKQWRIIASGKNKLSYSEKEVREILLTNRKIASKEDISEFLNPKLEKVTLKSSSINEKEFNKFRKRLESAISKNEKIIIFGDYDVDGICASAILWETIYSRSKNVFPYIPDRVDEGYGLSVKGIENLLEKHPDTKLIITVDNGIVAYEAVDFANEKNIDVVITDHHVAGEKLPKSLCIIHTTSLCGAGIAWVLAKELEFENSDKTKEKLELAALATVADLVPLLGNNRAIVKTGLEILKKTNRLGLLELYKEAGIDKDLLGIYSIGHLIAPRLNATGRIQSAMNALRLICTKDRKKAQDLAQQLGGINKERQNLTEESVTHAKMLALENTVSQRVTVIAHSSYNQGIIGLIASRLVESYYKPTFAIAIGEKISKGSARSIYGVNIIELLRSVKDSLIEAGGHPMAAGFSIETGRIEEFTIALSKKAEEVVTDEFLTRFLNIDLMIPFKAISKELLIELKKLEPFGMGNPEPVFATEDVEVTELRLIGREKNHLKLKVENDGRLFDAVAFGMADKMDVNLGDKVNIAYTIDENIWNGETSLQLKVKDIQAT